MTAHPTTAVLPLLYDVFCGAGGATRGYQDAGFRVIGIDSRPQPHYCGDGFMQMDAFAFLDAYALGELEPAAAFHCSPPCQHYSELTPMAYRQEHPDMLGAVLGWLRSQPLPFVCENVAGARQHMSSPVVLCGSMFGLNMWRHRWFEIGNAPVFFLLPPCNHSEQPVVVSGRGMRQVNGRRWSGSRVREMREAMQIGWMTKDEIMEAIPPAYTFFIGTQLMQYITVPA